jgi:signal transduction histidine kinase/BarA-like signal transduction histidine kinase
MEVVLNEIDADLLLAGSGEAALEILLCETEVPALALLDVQMPGMDGYELARLIRSRERMRGIPIIFVSAVYGDVQHINAGYVAGAVDFILKPLDTAVLISKIKVFLQLHALHAEKILLQEAHLQLKIDLAEKSSRDKSDFLANISHEIRTPMNAIIGFSTLCLRTELNDKQKGYLTKIDASAKFLLSLINDVLDHSKIEAGKLTLEAIPFQIGDALNNVYDIVSTLAAEKGLTISIEMAPEHFSASLIGDPLRLQQILLNLCSNAIKFSAHGHIRIHCQQEICTEESVTFCISVQDNGIGISPEHIEQLFTPFTQADTSITRRFGGTGLGLSISRFLTEKMGGHIWARSELGAGSSFFFTLKFKLEQNIQTECGSLREQIQQKMVHLRGIRVLVVEDDEFNQQVLSAMLMEFGLYVELAQNGHDALKQLKNRPYDVVLMDIQMPVMDGYATCELIRLNPLFSALPVIALTANVTKDAKHRCKQVGMTDFLTKPIDYDQLFSALLRWVAPPPAI